MDSQHNYRGRWNRGGRGWRGTARAISVGQTRGGRGRGQGNSIFTSTLQSTPHPSKPLGPAVDCINANTLLVELESPTIQDVRYIASYNWASGTNPMILVPGSPPAWTPPAEDTRLKADSENVFRDINAARYPTYPLEPAVRSVLAMKPKFDFKSLDIVGCGSTIGNLMRCAGGQPKPFRFDANVVGDTVLFVRRENSPTEIIPDLHGWGHTFPEAYTTWDADVRNSCSHQRIIQYDFGGLEILIRTETDGYVRPKLATPKLASNTMGASEDTTLEDTLDGLAVGTQVPSQSGTLKIRMAGNVISQDRIFDIKTRAKYKSYNMDEILPRLWANQTPNFVIAYHNMGLFDRPAVTPITRNIREWETTNSSLLARFHALVRRIMDMVRDSDHNQFEISWDGHGPLCITEQIGEGRTALPSDLLSLWDKED
ncbi:hypothetical protein BKA64DRAFT_338666 [Cadophora sp. MPI-SDFR-AT-0126]|nr:hypothetical protein BKA64DRAFT_338666 [Leotiomycetes sp. MPI-SDFR-AT-0126]